jgi:hypothetical protein
MELFYLVSSKNPPTKDVYFWTTIYAENQQFEVQSSKNLPQRMCNCLKLSTMKMPLGY